MTENSKEGVYVRLRGEVEPGPHVPARRGHHHHHHHYHHGSPAYSHQSKTHHGGVLTVMIMVGICHRRIPTIEYNDDDDNDNEKT